MAELGDLAFQLDPSLYSVNAPELTTFIEGYALTGQWNRAVELTDTAYELALNVRPMLCDTWQRIQNNATSGESRDKEISTILSKLQCPQP